MPCFAHEIGELALAVAFFSLVACAGVDGVNDI